jgi:hypothetical protein
MSIFGDKSGLYDEEVDCWISNQSAVTLFFFGLGCVFLSLCNPFIWLGVRVKLWLRR